MKWTVRSVITLIFLVLSTSCAYLQTHKNVEEIGAHYQGYLLNKKEIKVYQRKETGEWYVNARRAKFNLSYPVVHDSVFRRKDDSPTFEIESVEDHFVYHPIRESTAKILTRADGYMNLDVLAEDIQRGDTEWMDSLPNVNEQDVKAELAGKMTFQIPGTRVPFKKPLYAHILGKADFIVVDIPGTLVYNVAIPFMAPFVFFYEFTTSDD